MTAIICASGQQLVDDECMVVCTPEKNAECRGQAFPAVHRPSFCGFMPDGSWRNYTFQCQACNAGAIAVEEGACTCERVPCDDGFTCVEHQCVPIFDPCFPAVSSPAGCIASCAGASFDGCADTFAEAYRPSFCGWTKLGTWVNFTFDCEACQHSAVLGVVEGACSCENILCPGDQVCVEGSCVSPPPTCSQHQQCGKSSGCIDGKCVEINLPCKYRRCGKGFLFSHGRCTPDPQGAVDPCYDVQCPSGQACEDGGCVEVNEEDCPNDYEECINGHFFCPHPDPCFLIQCPSGFECSAGSCQPINIYTCQQPHALTGAASCVKGSVRENGRCVQYSHLSSDVCHLIQCPPHMVCKGGICVSRRIQGQLPAPTGCADGYFLHQGKCFPGSCVDVQCPLCMVCKNGICVFPDVNLPGGGLEKPGQTCDPCKGVKCEWWQVCRDGKCVGLQLQDRTPVPAVSDCNGVKCQPWQVCKDGKCVQRGVYAPPPPETAGKCPEGWIENDLGKCVAHPCKDVRCDPPQYCYNGICYYPSYFTDPSSDYQVNNQPTNKDACKNVTCQPWQTCKDGKCSGLQIKQLSPDQTVKKACNGLCKPWEVCRNGECSSLEIEQLSPAQTEGRDCKTRICFWPEICKNGQCIEPEQISGSPLDDLAKKDCKDVRCLPHEICRDGVCKQRDIVFPPEPSTPQISVACIKGYVIKNGRCVPDPCKDVKCSIWQTCKDGKCSAQFSPGVLSVLSSSPSQMCVRDRDCPALHTCVDGTCEQSACSSDQDCKYSWQMCSGGRCSDRCTVLECVNCQYGVCGYEPGEKCSDDVDCSDAAHSCVSRVCVDLCLTVPRCPAGWACWRGQCLPLQ